MNCTNCTTILISVDNGTTLICPKCEKLKLEANESKYIDNLLCWQKYSDQTKPAIPPTTISLEAREVALDENAHEWKRVNKLPYQYEQGHFVQQLLDAQKTISKKRINWLERKFLPCPDCRDKVKEGVCLRCANQKLEQQLSSLRVIAEGLNFLAGEVAEFNNHGQPTMLAVLAMKHQERYKEWLTLNPETKNV